MGSLLSLMDTLPTVADRLQTLLLDAGEMALAATVDNIQVFSRCNCLADDCNLVYTLPRQAGRSRGMLFQNANGEYTMHLRLVGDEISEFELFNDLETHARLVAAMPPNMEAEPEDCQGSRWLVSESVSVELQ